MLFRSLNFIPIGKETTVELYSDWHTPSFDGAFLPDSREINDYGFKARWHILHLNRNYPQQWIGSLHKVYDSAFGVSLKLPIDLYQKITRANKYALLFIVLTFTVFFFVEVITKMKIHPIQYLLAGFGLIVFFSLLLALSEHLSFNLSYFISSTAIISLIVFYVYNILHDKKITLIGIVILLLLYAFLFTILQIADYALLLGNIGLFTALALIMIVSRKVDWYNENKSLIK